ncbi:MAG: L,D-transpeptidase [bacterium]|jgi:L,D-transpeptidase YbiS|nr:L,D-transpeptidase [candidate division KSB1 bacterium]MDH7561377.1 L,D-transpeptidase [bacterium]
MCSDLDMSSSAPDQATATDALPPASKPHWFATAAAGIAAGLLLLLAAPALESSIEKVVESARATAPPSTTSGVRTAQERQLRRRVAELRRRFKRLTPAGHYLIVDTANNRIFVKSGDHLVHEGICSTGSYVMLRAGDKRTWVFKTPRGMFRVHAKLEAPVWRKPDWAFIEEGREPPPPTHPDRFEFGVLGEYALAFGDGYLVHGTLYKRLLGMPVTHGCVRLGDEDLRIVYHKLQEGSRIFVY